ncbi:MAG: DUF4173 domain-containing protein [Patescibacteria group bacterium]
MKKTFLILAVSLALGWLFDYFFFEKSPGIGFPIYVLLILGAIFGLASGFKHPTPKSSWIFALLLLFFSSMVFFRASGFLTFLNIVASLYLVLLLTNSFGGFNLNAIPLPWRYVKGFFGAMSDMLAARGTIQEHHRTPKVIRGIILALPFLILFLILFTSADLIFRQEFKELFDFKINSETIAHIILVLVVTCAYLGAFWYVFRRTEASPAITPASGKFHIGLIESSILLGSINTLFLLFILIQLRYLFGGIENITLEGFTYAEYARKGFFELIAVALLSFLLLFAVDKYAERSPRWLSSALIAQVFVIMASAFKRLHLYETAYGFTELRLYSYLVIIFLAIIFFVLVYKILAHQREEPFALNIFIIALVFLAGINIGNPDAFIARKNIDRFATTGKLDVEYLATLSDDALRELRKIPQIPEERFVKKEIKHWQSLHYSP